MKGKKQIKEQGNRLTRLRLKEPNNQILIVITYIKKIIIYGSHVIK